MNGIQSCMNYSQGTYLLFHALSNVHVCAYAYCDKGGNTGSTYMYKHRTCVCSPPVTRHVVDATGQRLLYVHTLSGHHGLHHRPHHVCITEHCLEASLLLGEVVHEFSGLCDSCGVPGSLLLQQLGYLRQGLCCQFSRSLGEEGGGGEKQRELGRRDGKGDDEEKKEGGRRGGGGTPIKSHLVSGEG